jgi:hypothetical protein
MSLEFIIPLVLPTIAEAIAQIGSRLFQEAPPLAITDQGVKLQSPDRQLSVGVTKRDGKEVPTLLVQKENSWAMEKAKDIEASSKGKVVINVTGQAFSSWPTKSVDSNIQSPHPGLSVGHYSGYAGTLGCLLRVKKTGQVALAGASHVLSIISKAKPGDAVLQPGYPDGPKTAENRIATLFNFTYLVHYSDIQSGTSLNTDDIAVAVLDNQENYPSANLLPDYKDADKKIKLKNVLSGDDLIDYLEKPVFKLGRTTGVTEGLFVGVYATPQGIRRPDGRTYLYENVLLVQNKGTNAFSSPGDSGSVVYTVDGGALGLIIGASDKFTFVSPMSSCLHAMNAELLV